MAQFHRAASESVGGDVIRTYDPILSQWHKLIPEFFNGLDYAVICSPSNEHRAQIKMALQYLPSHGQIIVEKPAWLPWELPIDDGRINIVMQLRWAKLPVSANRVSVQMVRGQDYFDSWKGDAKNTGGLFFNLFIHYIDLAQRLNADFHGKVIREGENIRMVDGINLSEIDNQGLYNDMYLDIIGGQGVKPWDLFYLNWALARHSELYGYGLKAVDQEIIIDRRLL